MKDKRRGGEKKRDVGSWGGVEGGRGRKMGGRGGERGGKGGGEGGSGGAEGGRGEGGNRSCFILTAGER